MFLRKRETNTEEHNPIIRIATKHIYHIQLLLSNKSAWKIRSYLSVVSHLFTVFAHLPTIATYKPSRQVGNSPAPTMQPLRRLIMTTAAGSQ